MADPNDPHAWLTELNSRRTGPKGPAAGAATEASVAAMSPQTAKNIIEGFNLHNRLLALEALVGKLTETIEKQQGGTSG